MKNSSLTEKLATWLRQRGFGVDRVSCSRGGYQALKSETYSVVIVEEACLQSRSKHFLAAVQGLESPPELILLGPGNAVEEDWVEEDKAVRIPLTGLSDSEMMNKIALRLRHRGLCSGDHRVLQALETSELQYRNLFDSIPDAILVADTERRVIDCNQAFQELFGYRLRDIYGEPTSVLYQDHARFERLGKELRENDPRGNFFFTIQYRRKNGRTFPGETHVFYRRNAADEITGFIGLIHDVSRQRETEENLRQGRVLLNRIMQTSPVGIAVFDQNLDLTYTNQRAEVKLGLSEVSGNGSIPPGQLPPSLLTLVEGVLETHRGVDQERITARGSARRRRILSVNAAPLSDRQGETSGVVVSLEDVTAQVREEEELKSRLENELGLLQELAAAEANPVTASALGLKPLRDKLPAAFRELKGDYFSSLELALEEKVYKVSHDVSSRLRELAAKLGALRATPRDVVQLHRAALEENNRRMTVERLEGYAEEGRLLLLELMGYLTAFYRARSLGSRNEQRQEKLEGQDERGGRS